MNNSKPFADLTPGIYRHFKGNKYELLHLATHSETQEPMVVYRALYGEGGLWVRPASMWCEPVACDGRLVRRFEREETGTNMYIKTALTEADFRQMHELEARYYDESHISPWREAWQWYQSYPWYNAVLACEDRIVAFVDMFPITDALFELMKTGAYNDAALRTEDIADITKAAPGDGPFHMFLCCLVVDADFRGRGALSRLLCHQVEFYRQFEEKGIEIDYIITDNVSEEGCHFSRKMGFDKLTDTKFGSVINLQPYKNFANRVMKGE